MTLTLPPPKSTSKNQCMYYDFFCDVCIVINGSLLLCSRSLRFISSIIERPLCHLCKNIRPVCKLD